MSKFRLLLPFLFFFTFVSVFSQNPDEEKIKEKQRREIVFLENVLEDARNLRLPENRAYVYAKLGDAFWQSDEKRARALFQNSINELIAAQSEIEGEKKNQQFFRNLLYGQSPRWEILWLIANRDAELALEAQARTRPARLPLSLQDFGDTQIYSNVYQFVRNEIQNEQRLISIAAEQNPQRAAKLLRESLKKDITYEALNLLRKVHEKDSELAARLAEEIGEKFLSADLTKGYETMNVLSNFITEFGRERAEGDKGLRISERLVRDLAAKMIDAWMNPDVTSFNGYSNPAIFEKYFPERIAKVKQKFKQSGDSTQPKEYEEYNRLIASNPSGEELLNQVNKFPKNIRSQIFHQAAQKFAQEGNIAEAEKTIRNVYPDQAEYYVSQWQNNLAMKAVGEEKFDEASRIISLIENEDTQINALIYLAMTIFQKDRKENKNRALSILDQARAIIPDQPETYSEINSLMNLAVQYAALDPSRAFSLVESMIPQMDELSQAQAVLARYQPGNGSFRRGEFQFISGNYAYGAYNLTNILRELKKEDPERVLRITNRFTRLDMRLSVQIQLAEGGSLQIANLPISRRSFIID